MADATAQAAVVLAPSGRPRTRRAWVDRRLWFLVLLVATGVAYWHTDAAAAPLVLPVLVMVNVAGVYFVTLWHRDRELPVFEIGSLWVAATLLYSAGPFINFVASDLRWSIYGDGRLLAYPFDIDAIAGFGWRYVLYLTSFVAVYLTVRGRWTAAGTPLERVPRSTAGALLTVLVGQWVFQRLIYVVYGVEFDISYAELPTKWQPEDMPYVLWQVTLIVLASRLVVKQALLLLLIARWRDVRWRLLLLGWLAFEVVSTVMQMGARGSAVRLLLTFAVLYHRFVRPVGPFWLVVGGLTLLAGFLGQGVLRGRPTGEGRLDLQRMLTSTNEFQALFATAYDLYQRRLASTLADVPWQIPFSDLYLIIPSQLLPFYKWDPANWYLEAIGVQGTGVGFMFGVMAQAVLGFDWIELAVRGALLGFLFALLHRWYVRQAAGLWPTLLYLFVTVWSYYTFRATSFYILHFVVYQFLPIMVTVVLLSGGWRRLRRVVSPR